MDPLDKILWALKLATERGLCKESGGRLLCPLLYPGSGSLEFEYWIFLDLDNIYSVLVHIVGPTTVDTVHIQYIYTITQIIHVYGIY